MGYMIAFESKPESGYQTQRGSRWYMSKTQAVNAARKMADKEFNVSAMQTTSTGGLVAILWTNNKPMNVFTVTFADGNTMITSMNATIEEAMLYYVGNEFNFGDPDGPDRMVKAVSVELRA